MKPTRSFSCLAAAWMLSVAGVAEAAVTSKSEPIEISSDTLDVLQNDHQAIFTGKVVAVQGTTQMRAAKMVVFYHATDAADAKTKLPAPAAAPAAAMAGAAAPQKAAPGQGIERIEATDHVVFTTPTETAEGDRGVYNVATDTIDLFGKEVTLTRESNVLKGTHLNHNMTTGRSVLTGSVAGARPPRVHGLFIPKSDKK